MEDDRTFVAMLKHEGSKPFLFVTLNSDRTSITRAACGMSEGDLTAALHKMGMPHPEIKSLVEDARKNPV